MIEVRRVAVVVALSGNVAFSVGTYHIVRAFGPAAFVSQFGECDNACGPDLANGIGVAGLVASVAGMAFAGSAAAVIALCGTFLVATGLGILAGAAGYGSPDGPAIASGAVPLLLGLIALGLAVPAPSWRARLYNLPAVRLFRTETQVGEGWWAAMRPATATVLDREFTGQTLNERSVYVVRVRLVADGGDPVEASRPVLVPEGVVVAVGDVLSAFYDPTDPRRFVLSAK